MTKLDNTISLVLQQLKPELAAETWGSRRRYYNQMLRLANSLGITEPCQDLYDAYVADDGGSKERRGMHIRCVRLLDAVAGTGAKDERGILYNEPPLPSIAEAQEYFAGKLYPLSERSCIDHIIIKAEIEMQYLTLTESTIGQYRHAWRDIRRYFHRNCSTEYNEQLLNRFIDEIEIQRTKGSMEEWKWKINRRAAYVLIEVANTGLFHWSHIVKGINCDNAVIEEIRQQHLVSLRQRNLSRTTIGLYDYVFRKLIELAGVKNTNELSALSQEAIHSVVTGFSSFCSRRSMTTIIPILRSVLVFLNISGYLPNDMSHVVMSGFVHKGSVPSYLAREDQSTLLTQIEQEPKRTKAIILLAMKLGLRDCDICNLTFQKIDWHKDKIKLLQEKTEEPITLPLLPDVGNALMDYILNERPKRDDRYPYVFLRMQAPHNKLTSTYSVCSKLLKKLEITPVNRSSAGVHVFRYTMVHNLLAAKTPHQVITDVLGHVSKESDKPYLSMEESMLRLCAMDLSVIGKVSWEGGI